MRGILIISLGIKNNSFYGVENPMAVIDGRKKRGYYRVNYEVKALSSKNSVKSLYDKISIGVNQTLKRGTGKRRIGVLIVDKDAWLKVAKDPVYGKLLKQEYIRLTSGASTESKNYLRLIAGFSNEVNRAMYGLRDKVREAEENKDN